MDINNIIIQSMKETVKNISNNELMVELPKELNELNCEAKTIKFLMSYTGTLLKNYNDELSKILSSHDIQL